MPASRGLCRRGRHAEPQGAWEVPISGQSTLTGGERALFLFFQSRKCLPQVTQGCSGPHTGCISRVSAETCCAISWPELSRPTPRIFAPFVRIRHRQTKPAAAPRRAAQLAPRPLPTLASRLRLCIKVARRARYGPTQPKRGVVGWRLWLLAPLRARGKTPSGRVSNSREVYGC